MTYVEFKTYVEFYYTAAWHVCEDVLPDPAPTWEYGLPGNGPMDLVADTGTLTFTLDNSEANAAALAGYYTPGHANAPAWFVDGLKVRVRCERQDDMTIATRFIGWITDITPSSGAYLERTTDVMATDWMEFASIQKLGPLALQTGAGLGVDDVLTAALVPFDVQPESTNFDVGAESFASIFNTDDAIDMTMASLFQKYARNEGGGFIYLTGAGALTFDNRNARPAMTTPSFTLNDAGETPMSELDVAWNRQQIWNRIECRIWPSEVDAAATTSLWTLRDGFAISAAQTIVLTCPFRDPDTGARISGFSVVDPLVEGTHIKLGTVDDGTTHDIHNFSATMDVGGNSADITIVNDGGAATTNYCKNPSFEVNVTDDWTLLAGGGAPGTKNLDATQYKVGAKSMRIRSGNEYTFAKSTTGVSVPNNGTVTASCWIRCSADPTPGKAWLRVIRADTLVENHVHASAAANGAWEYLSVSYTNTAGSAQVFHLDCISTFNDSAADLWFDACQLELQAAATTYCDGTQQGCSWAGTAHNSTSSRQAVTAGYVNYINLLGKGIYTYDPMVVFDEDTTSITARGERVLDVALEQVSNPNTAESLAALLLAEWKDPKLRVGRVRFLANTTDDLATAALTVEPNTRFGIAEALTDTLSHYHACRLSFQAQGPLLWVDIVPAPASDLVYFIYDDATLEPVSGHHVHGWDHGVLAF